MPLLDWMVWIELVIAVVLVMLLFTLVLLLPPSWPYPSRPDFVLFREMT